MSSCRAFGFSFGVPELDLRPWAKKHKIIIGKARGGIRREGSAKVVPLLSLAYMPYRGRQALCSEKDSFLGGATRGRTCATGVNCAELLGLRGKLFMLSCCKALLRAPSS